MRATILTPWALPKTRRDYRISLLVGIARDVLATVEKIIEKNPCRKWITVEQAYQQVQLDRSRVREDGVPRFEKERI